MLLHRFCSSALAAIYDRVGDTPLLTAVEVLRRDGPPFHNGKRDMVCITPDTNLWRETQLLSLSMCTLATVSFGCRALVCIAIKDVREALIQPPPAT